jgi:hypothetical protein
MSTRDRATLWTVVGMVVAGVVLTLVVSYSHEYELAHHNGQVRWIACLMPFCVDGMVLVALAALFWAIESGVRGFTHLWQPLLTGVVGVSATIAANYYSDKVLPWLGPAVAASSGVSAVLMGLVAHWMLSLHRRLADGETVHAKAACSCAPPATSLAEAIPVARRALRDAGLPHGQEALAARFETTPHQVRKILAPPVEKAAMNGSGHGSAPA